MDPQAEQRLRELAAKASLYVDAKAQMGPRAEESLRELLAEASSLIPAKGGRLLFDCEYGETILWGDRVGFLRLGIGLASGALRPPKTAYGVDNVLDTEVRQFDRDDPSTAFIFHLVPDWSAIDLALDAKGNTHPLEKERLRVLPAGASLLIPSDCGGLLLDRGPDGEIDLWGDQAGFLRLGIGLASGALRTPKTAFGADDAVDTGVNLYLSDGSHAPFFIRWARDWTEIERVVHRKQRASERKAVIFFGVIIAIFLRVLVSAIALKSDRAK